MKVIAGMPWKLDWDMSGFSKHINAIFNAISDLGVDLKLYCLGPKKDEKFSLLEVPVNSIAMDNIFSPLFNSVAFSHEFSKIIEKEHFDILHCFNTATLFLKSDKKYIFQTANPTYSFVLDAVKDEYPETEKFKRLLKYYSTVIELEKYEYSKTDIIIAKSEAVKKNIVEYYDIEPSKIHIVPNGVLPNEYRFNRPPKAPGNMKIVLFPGTIRVMKGFRYVVEAMAEVRKSFPETIFIVPGRIYPLETDLIMELVNKYRKKSGIVLTGFIPWEELSKYYHMADVCCIPLIFGNMQISILEALAHGLPIVTTEHSGFPEIEQVGIKVPPKDSHAIAEAIIKLISQPKFWKHKSKRAIDLIKKYDWVDAAKKTVEIYKMLV